MFWMVRFFLSLFKSTEEKPAVNPGCRIPAVKFNSSAITEAAKADIRKNIARLEWIDPEYFDKIYDAAICSVSNLSLLFNVLMQMNIDGMTKVRAAQITRFLSFKAKVVIENERRLKLGITEAIWQYSGAPCEINPTKPIGMQDAEHKAANGKRFNISKGMLIGGKYIWPGYEDGCKCTSRAVIPGFED